MDITTIGWIATTTFTLLKPFLIKWAESISWEIWKNIWNKIKEKFSSIWKWEIITNLETSVNDKDIWKAELILEDLIEKDDDLFDFLKNNLPKLENEVNNIIKGNSNTIANNINGNNIQNVSNSTINF